MKFKAVHYIILFMFTIVQSLSAQLSLSSSKKDRFNFDSWYADSKPFIELNYGVSAIKHKTFHNEFAEHGLSEFKLGFRTLDFYDRDFILELDDKYVFVSLISNDLRSGNNLLDIESETWRMGIGGRSAYGYKFGGISIIPYYQSALVWTKFDFTLPDVRTEQNFTGLFISEEDQKIMDRYNKTFRFGSLYEGGLQINLMSFLSFNGGYEASVIYPRHLVWKQFISYGISEAGQSAVDFFVDEIIDSSPAAGPIINFLLKNGLAFAYYSLQRNDMNWPFPTETPLTVESVKFGLTFTF